MSVSLSTLVVQHKVLGGRGGILAGKKSKHVYCLQVFPVILMCNQEWRHWPRVNSIALRPELLHIRSLAFPALVALVLPSALAFRRSTVGQRHHWALPTLGKQLVSLFSSLLSITLARIGPWSTVDWHYCWISVNWTSRKMWLLGWVRQSQRS